MNHSDWLVFGRDLTVRIITMETVLSHIFSLSREIQVERITNGFQKAEFSFQHDSTIIESRI